MPVATGSGKGAIITGVVYYRERMAVPPEAEVRVSLEDVSLADTAAVRIAETRFQARGGPPYAFALGYDPSKIESHRLYTLRASIRLGEKLLFASMEHVDAFDSTTSVEIQVRRVSGR